MVWTHYMQMQKIMYLCVELISSGQTWETSHSSNANVGIRVFPVALLNVLSGTPHSLLVVSGDSGREVVVLPLSGGDSSLHHKAACQLGGICNAGTHRDSLDLLEGSSSRLGDDKVDEGDREETSKGVDE